MRTITLHLCALTVTVALNGCGSPAAPAPDGDGTAGSTVSGGSANTAGNGAASAGGPSGGSTAAGGASSGGGATATGAGGGTAGAATGGKAGAGSGGTAGAATGGTTGAGGATTGGASATGGAASGPDCSATLPTGGTPYSGAMANGTADGLGYGIWSNGSGGTITVFNNAHAFSASWNNGGDFLAHLGLDFNGTSAKSYTAYSSIKADIVETKTGTGGGYSSLGMYGWTQKPCVEWYIVDDSFNKMPTQKSSVTTTIDGGTYYLITNSTSGSGGNACESGHAGPWTQMWSVRSTARQCGTITVSDHFAAWTKQGWALGNLTSVHINVEVGGGMGSIQFPVANVTASSN